MKNLGQLFDYIIIGSGFGASVSAMRLTEKGYSVLIIEKGRRFHDQDFARTNLLFLEVLVDSSNSFLRHPANKSSQGHDGSAWNRRGWWQLGVRQCSRNPHRRHIRHSGLAGAPAVGGTSAPALCHRQENARSRAKPVSLVCR